MAGEPKAEFFMTFLPRAFLYYIVLALAAPLPAQAQQPSLLAQIDTAKAAIVTVLAENDDLFQSRPAIAGIDKKHGRIMLTKKIAQASYQRSGAGVIIDPSGIIVTNAHIVTRAKHIKVTLTDGQQVEAQIVFAAEQEDIALLQIQPPHALKAVSLADSDQIHLRDEIISIGNSPLLNQTVSGGKVIGLGRSRSGKVNDQTNKLIQTTITLYSGDSGGPLFDRQGRLIGLMTAKETSSDRSSFAVPANKIAQHLIDYRTKKSKMQNHEQPHR